jgi:2-keto-4-pentenoate hydratase/2-oxohepta-3-ene-1,7-dioic acid hydratase in catechol pathway
MRTKEEVVQEGSTSGMIFGMPALVSFISHIMTLMTLEPGDVIATGTPPQRKKRLPATL